MSIRERATPEPTFRDADGKLDWEAAKADADARRTAQGLSPIDWTRSANPENLTPEQQDRMVDGLRPRMLTEAQLKRSRDPEAFRNTDGTCNWDAVKSHVSEIRAANGLPPLDFDLIGPPEPLTPADIEYGMKLIRDGR